MKSRVGILGCGRIAGGADSVEGDVILTHAKAILRHPSLELQACFDPVQERADAFAQTWSCNTSYHSLESFFAEALDICVIASSTNTHYKLLQSAKKSSAKTILCEKPLVTTRSELEELLEYPKTLVTNYTRRWDENHVELREKISSGELGEAISFHGYVSGGMIHNGCHLIDLLYFLLSPIELCATQKEELIGNDLYGLYSLSLECGATGAIQSIPQLDYSFFELEIVFSKGCVSINDIGCDIQVFTPHDSHIFPGRNHLRLSWNPASTLERAMYNLYNSLAEGSDAFEQYHLESIAGSRILFGLLENAKDRLSHAGN